MIDRLELRRAQRAWRPHAGFTLIEMLVALVVFAALAAAAYGGLAAIARTRAALAVQQDRFAALTRSVSALERDLRQAVARPVRGNDGTLLPALVGSSDSIEFTHTSFANPRAEPRSNLERVVYAFDSGTLRRARYLVLDRAPASTPAASALIDKLSEMHLRYLSTDGASSDSWPPAPISGHLLDMPRAVEFRLNLKDLGEIRRVVELPAAFPISVSSTGNSQLPDPSLRGTP